VTVITVLLALALTGALSARIGGGTAKPAVLRMIIGGAIALAVTYAIGHLFGTAIS